MREETRRKTREAATPGATTNGVPPSQPPGEEPDLSPVPWPAPPEKEAYHGLAGEVVEAIDPETEADKVAILAQFLVFYGNACGRHVYRQVGAKRHYPNLFAVLVGRTAKGRKGTSLSWVESLFEGADPLWTRDCVQTGLSSGEGFISAVRDRVERNGIAIDDGVSDKRLLVIEEEFASVMRIAARDGNILSTVLRRAFDGTRLQTMTKHSPLRATGAHVCIVGHITREELVGCLSETDQRNGFANRFLWLAVKRSKWLPDGGSMVNLSYLQELVKGAVRFAGTEVRMDRTMEARELWHSVYRSLSAEQPGALGLVTSRGEAIVLRLAMIYALLDLSVVIDVPHLKAALALWNYSLRSCTWVFGDSTGDADSDLLLAALQVAGAKGMTASEVSAVFGRHKSAGDLKKALGRLVEFGLADMVEEKTAGRPRAIWRATGCEKSEQSERSETTRTCDENHS